MNIAPVQISERLISPNHPCFIIAEAGVNHNGDLNLAHKLIDSAIATGADAIKFQSFLTEELITPEAPKAKYQVETTGESGSQYKMLKALELSAQQQAELKKHCDDVGIIYTCTPYDRQSVDLLDKLEIAAFKIASTDTTNIPFLRYLATKNRPLILSTGMSSLGEVEEAVNTLYSAGVDSNIILLHCTSQYPAPISEVNLRAIITMQQAFNCPVGFSDHTAGIGASPWAVALGACAIEKHFTLDRNLDGPDHRASLEPQELSALVQTVREVETALGDGIKRSMPSEIENKPMMQKSLVAGRHIAAGAIISADDLTCKRPGFGLKPSWFDKVVGQKAAIDLKKDQVLTLSSINWQ